MLTLRMEPSRWWNAEVWLMQVRIEGEKREGCSTDLDFSWLVSKKETTRIAQHFNNSYAQPFPSTRRECVHLQSLESRRCIRTTLACDSVFVWSAYRIFWINFGQRFLFTDKSGSVPIWINWLHFHFRGLVRASIGQEKSSRHPLKAFIKIFKMNLSHTF